MATPHIEANKGDFADVELMPGDPMRAKLIAETYLEDLKPVNQVRGILGYTGTYKGKRISVMASAPCRRDLDLHALRPHLVRRHPRKASRIHRR